MMHKAMNPLLLLPVLLLFLISCSTRGEETSDSGYSVIVTIDPFPSINLQAAAVDICFPSGYSPWKKYKVLYLHDPDTDPSSISLYDSEWLSKQTRRVLKDSLGVKECILVWIRTFYPEQGEDEFAGKFTRLVGEEVRPYVENEYNTQSGKQAAFFAALDPRLAQNVASEYPASFAATATSGIVEWELPSSGEKKHLFYFIPLTGH